MFLYVEQLMDQFRSDKGSSIKCEQVGDYVCLNYGVIHSAMFNVKNNMLITTGGNAERVDRIIFHAKKVKAMISDIMDGVGDISDAADFPDLTPIDAFILSEGYTSTLDELSFLSSNGLKRMERSTGTVWGNDVCWECAQTECRYFEISRDPDNMNIHVSSPYSMTPHLHELSRLIGRDNVVKFGQHLMRSWFKYLRRSIKSIDDFSNIEKLRRHHVNYLCKYMQRLYVENAGIDHKDLAVGPISAVLKRLVKISNSLRKHSLRLKFDIHSGTIEVQHSGLNFTPIGSLGRYELSFVVTLSAFVINGERIPFRKLDDHDLSFDLKVLDVISSHSTIKLFRDSFSSHKWSLCTLSTYGSAHIVETPTYTAVLYRNKCYYIDLVLPHSGRSVIYSKQVGYMTSDELIRLMNGKTGSFSKCRHVPSVVYKLLKK